MVAKIGLARADNEPRKVWITDPSDHIRRSHANFVQVSLGMAMKALKEGKKSSKGGKKKKKGAEEIPHGPSAQAGTEATGLSRRAASAEWRCDIRWWHGN